MLPILKLLLEVIRLPELSTDGSCASGRAGFGFPPCGVPLVPIMLPILQLLLELIRLSDPSGRRTGLPAGGLCVEGTPGFCVLTILPICEPILEPIRLPSLPRDVLCVSGALDFCILITLPMRVLILELRTASHVVSLSGLTGIRLLEIPAGGLGSRLAGALCVSETSGFVVVIGLAMREVMLEFIWLSEFTIGCLAPSWRKPSCGLPLCGNAGLEGLRSEGVIPVRMEEGRLSVISPD